MLSGFCSFQNLNQRVSCEVNINTSGFFCWASYNAGLFHLKGSKNFVYAFSSGKGSLEIPVPAVPG